jgi:glycosyltransferase involved in cell wall biosynthesis
MKASCRTTVDEPALLGDRGLGGGPDADDPDLVSVILPAYNAEKFIGRTLLSVTDQSYRNLEVIVVDDGSKDGTAAIVEEFARRDHRVRLIRQENAGVRAARNRAIANARGGFVAPIDADDLWHRDKLAVQVEALRAAPPTTAVAYCWWVPIDEQDVVKENGRIPFPCQFEGNVLIEMAVQNFIGNGSIPLIRRSALRDIGGYDPDQSLCSDWQLYFELAEHGDYVLVRRALVGYRQWSGSLSSAVGSMERRWKATTKWIRQRYPRLPRNAIRRQIYHGHAYLFRLAVKRQALIKALRHMIVAAASGPVRFSVMLIELLQTTPRRFRKTRSCQSITFFQLMAIDAS